MKKISNSYILTKTFTRQMITELINEGNSITLDKSFIEIYHREKSNISNYRKIQMLYGYLTKYYRNEYFYKNTLINKVLVGIHSVNTTTALTELPINKSKADIVMINGKAVVYEIKTELDSLQRINNQINDYYKAFTHVSVIIDKSHEEKILKEYWDSPVGIYILTDRVTIQTIKEPEQNYKLLDPLVMYKVLRKAERYDIVNKFYNKIPEFNQFEEFDEVFKLFKSIEEKKMYSEFILKLKERSKVKQDKKYFDDIPKEIKSLVYFEDPGKSDYIQLGETLQKGGF